MLMFTMFSSYSPKPCVSTKLQETLSFPLVLNVRSLCNRQNKRVNCTYSSFSRDYVNNAIYNIFCTLQSKRSKRQIFLTIVTYSTNSMHKTAVDVLTFKLSYFNVDNSKLTTHRNTTQPNPAQRNAWQRNASSVLSNLMSCSFKKSFLVEVSLDFLE